MADQKNPLTLCFVTTGDHPLFFLQRFAHLSHGT
jgi:hypothetical protein